MKKILALLLAFSFVFALAACGGNEAAETTTAVQTPDDVPTTVIETTLAATTVNGETTTAIGETTTAALTDKLPETTEEILAAYTAVMNQAKADKPSFNKYEYQQLPDDEASRKVTQGKTLVNTVLPLAEHFMTTEEDAKAEPEFREKGGDMRWFPVYKSPKGCILTDASAIKSASAKQLPNGNYQLTIVLKSEKNPEPCADGASTSPSKTGAMFSPLSKADIDKELNGDFVSAVAKNIVYNLTYHDCKAVLTYNPKTNQVIELEQLSYVTIVGSGKVIGMAFEVQQELINTMKIYNVKY